MDSQSHIAGTEKLAAILGEWPSFHDAEVISFSLERGLPFRKGYTSARLVVNIRRFALEYSDSIHYEQALKRNVLVKFAFSGICEMEIAEWNHQNVINSIEVTSDETRRTGRLKVEIESIFGFGGTFLCAAIEVEDVEVLASD